MFGTQLLGINSKEVRLSRRDFLLGIAVAGTVALPMLSTPARAAVSMLRTGLDPDLVETESEIVPVKRGGGGKGRDGKGGHSRGKGRGGSRSKGRGGSRGRGRSYYGSRSRERGHRYYGGRYGVYGSCRNPWYRRRYWYRCYL